MKIFQVWKYLKSGNILGLDIYLEWKYLSEDWNVNISFGTECDIHMDFDTNEYPNIFVSRKLHERISEYIRMKFFGTNEYPNIFVSKILYERRSE